MKYSKYAMNVDSILLDAHSLKILFELQRDARQTVQQISEAVGLSPTPCWKRIKDMEAAGVIRGYTALIDREKVGLHVAAVAEVNLDRHSESQVQSFEDAVAASPQITSCVSATGPADYILTVLVQDMKHYERFLHDDPVQPAGRDACALEHRAAAGEVGDGAADRAGGAAGRAGARAAALRGA